MDDLFGSPTSGPTKGGAMDPAAEFAARERAALGADDAGLLAGGADANSSGGAGAFPSMDDFEARAGAFPDLDLDDGAARGASPAVGVDDDFGGLADRDDAPVLHQQPSSVSVTNDNEIAAFESQYPEVEPLSQQQQPELGQPMFAAPAQATNSYPPTQTSIFGQSPAQQAAAEEESDFIREWKVKQSEDIARREEAAKKRREHNIVEAREWIDNFYREYNEKKAKSIAKNKEDEDAFNEDREAALGRGTTWERVADLIDLQDSRSKTNTKSTKDLARFKEILLTLKRDGESAPGAGGY